VYQACLSVCPLEAPYVCIAVKGVLLSLLMQTSLVLLFDNKSGVVGTQSMLLIAAASVTSRSQEEQFSSCHASSAAEISCY